MAQTLITIPNTKAYHVPPGGAPVFLAEGPLVLSVIPAHTPDHPKETITLSVGSASFPLDPRTPVVKTEANAEHPSFAFRPQLGGETRVGKVKVSLKESTGPAEYERTEAMAMAFENTLKGLGCWKEMGYYDIEDEEDAALAATSGATGYGTTIADTLTTYGKWLASRIESLTDSRLKNTPAGESQVPEGLKSAAETTKNGSQSAVGVTHSATETIGEVVHDGAAYLGALAQGAVKSLHDAVAGPTTASIADSELGKGTGEVATNVGAAAGETWEEVKLGAAGAATGTKEVTDALAESTYRNVDHSYGSEASKVARDVGATGSNAAGVALDATLVTSVYKHGYDASTGAVEGYQAGGK